MLTLRPLAAVHHIVNCIMELVQVEFEYEYTAKNGSRVSIKPNDRYILVSRTNEHWWHVQKDQSTKPFYIPAKYVRELSVETQGTKNLTKPCAQNQSTPKATADRDPVNLSDRGPMPATVTTKVRVSKDPFGRSPATHRMSTFGTPQDINNIRHQEHKIMVRLQTSNSETRDTPPHLRRCSLGPDFSFASNTPDLDDLLQFPPPPPEFLDDSFGEPTSEDWSKTLPGFPSRQSDLAQHSDIRQTVSNKQHSELTDLLGTKLSESPGSTNAPAEPQQSLNQTSRLIDVKAPSHTDQVVNESAQDAVYVNVKELRRSISERPPSTSPPFSFTPHRNAEGWEVHTDQESGQEYYYHPASGQTTWDNPLLLDMDPEPPSEEPACSSPAFSLAPSSVAASPPTWTDWQQCLDEVSGRTYFYNPVSEESSWDAPEPPYPGLIGPQSGHTPQGEGPPPLPDEDYPADDLDEVPEAHDKLSPHSFPKDYDPSHLSRSVLPRASLDRNAPTGWNLNIDPDGTWVFSSQHSPEEWIKSLDDRGQTYYYLRDGSKSEWNLPEAPVATGQSTMGNGYGLGEVSAMKNKRHTLGPASLATQEGNSFRTHRRNLSDNGSEGSGADSSPEISQHHVQALEKAGILNKTKVSENGKRVRKNWTQTWTVLHGGVLTFHKEPKSSATGGQYKSNHIVPEVTVDLRGASIGWASKDKSSKKNVVELKSKTGVEFLIQYETDSIIQDWYKVLEDTIQQPKEPLYSEVEDEEAIEKPSSIERPVSFRTNTANSSSGETDQKKVRTKLMKFLMKRPTLQSIKEKGYIRDNVFGCHLAVLCAREETTIPSFVEKCIKAVEKRGVEMDGLYRVSGNLAVIQKLRFKADHDELDLEDGQWEDIHVITGALKLFFRELPEPLFPFSHFRRFIQAIRMAEHNQKVVYMHDLVESLPKPNRDTMELLFNHLRKVINCGEENRMTVQNVAIVFGPTLLRPEMDSGNLAMNMVFQNQIVELILNEHDNVF